MGRRKTETMSPTPEQFRSAMELCLHSYDAEHMPEERVRLARAALLLAEVAEHIERGESLTPVIIASCRYALTFVPDEDARRKIEIQLRQVQSTQSVSDRNSPTLRFRNHAQERRTIAADEASSGVQRSLLLSQAQPTRSVGDTNSRASRFRNYADELRTIASDGASSDVKQSLQRTAADYDRVATSLEALDESKRILVSAGTR